MASPSRLEAIRYKVSRAFKALWGGIISVFFFLLIILFWSADISSCIKRDDSEEEKQAAKLKIIEVSAENVRHAKIEHALDRLWLGATGKENPKLLIVDSQEINAASFGSGRFLVWDGVANLPDAIIDSIFAHEIAHDLLRHSKKAQDAKDLTDFVGDVLSVFGRTDAETENTLKRWVGYTALPKYSRNQEFEADAKAIEILAALGHDHPEAELSKALQVLLDKYGNTGGRFLDSHPSTSERIQRLNDGARHNVAR